MLFNTFKYFAVALLSLSIAGASCKSKKVEPQKTSSSQKADALNGYLYISGCHERAKGNYAEALKIFFECKENGLKDPALFYEIATVLKITGRTNEALNYARPAAVAQPLNEWYQLLYIDCLDELHQYSQAIKMWEALVHNFPARTDFKEDLAIQYAKMGQYDKSFKIYSELEATYGINEQIVLNKVKLLKSQQKNREVEQELLALIKTDTLQTRYWSYLAEYYFEDKAFEQAKTIYEKILVIDPNDVDVHLAFHDYYINVGDEKTAYQHLKLALQNPNLEISTKATVLDSYYLQAESKNPTALKEGLELAEIVLKVHPSAPEANYMYADFLRLQGKIAEAAGYYYKAVSAEGKKSKVWDNLLFCDNELNRFDSLERHSELAMEVFPNNPNYYIYNGVANTQLHNYKKAASSLKSGVGYVVGNKALLIQFYSALGDAYYYLQDYGNSDAWFEKALKEDADNTYVLNNYAYYLSLRNTALDKAEKLSKRSNELQPNNKNYMDTYGWILFQQKKYTQADEWLSKASRLGTRNPTILEHFGDNLFMLGKTEEALNAWQEASKAGGNSEQLLRKIREKKIK